MPQGTTAQAIPARSAAIWTAFTRTGAYHNHILPPLKPDSGTHVGRQMQPSPMTRPATALLAANLRSSLALNDKTMDGLSGAASHVKLASEAVARNAATVSVMI